MTGADIIEANADWLDDAMEGVMFGMRCIVGHHRFDGAPFAVFWLGNRHVQCPLTHLGAAEAASIRAELTGISRFGRRSIEDMLPA